jgi:hypothetical protein
MRPLQLLLLFAVVNEKRSDGFCALVKRFTPQLFGAAGKQTPGRFPCGRKNR